MRWLKQLLDQLAIRHATRSLPRVAPDPHQGSEVEKALSRADLFRPPERTPEVQLTPEFVFQFPSAVQTPFPRNNMVRGRILPAGKEWKSQPSVVLVHGWNAEMHYIKGMPSLAREFMKRGVNGVMIELPYHLNRRPAADETVTNFISENLPRMIEATIQAVADLNGLIHWLKAQGSPAVALWGFSLGAWLSGLHVSHSRAQDAAVLTTPLSDLERAVRELAFCFPIRAALEVAPADLGRFNLRFYKPQIAPEKILLVESKYDQFVPGETCGELARAWGIRDWPCYPQSHISILASRRANRRTIAWLCDTLRPGYA